jgi:hypothetical protein
MSNAKLGSSYDDKFSGMELGKLRAMAADLQAKDKEIERLECSLKISQEKHRLSIEYNKRLEAAAGRVCDSWMNGNVDGDLDGNMADLIATTEQESSDV